MKWAMINFFPGTGLQTAANSVTPCNNINDTLCEGDLNDEQYPEDAIKTLLYRHKLFANKEFFQRLFSKVIYYGIFSTGQVQLDLAVRSVRQT